MHTVSTLGAILAGMMALSLVEVAMPLHARGHWNRAHLMPNLALTLVTFATNALLGGLLILALMKLESYGLGLLARSGLTTLSAALVAVLALDLSTYAAHVAMHKTPGFWRFHRIHHADPALDVTTSLRQHPGESVIRHAFLASSALCLGASPAAYAIYRFASALSALLEHANIRLPASIDDRLALIFCWPNMHKVHHSRDARHTNTNYGNLVSWWDRLFGTLTPARLGANVAYGLCDFDDPASQTTSALLAAPFLNGPARLQAAPNRPMERNSARS